jgi:hypothetical protein
MAEIFPDPAYQAFIRACRLHLRGEDARRWLVLDGYARGLLEDFPASPGPIFRSVSTIIVTRGSRKPAPEHR